MSDLEATSSRRQNAAPLNRAAPITRLAQGKLRSLASGGAAIADSEGLLDAFAEVFARMAVAAPPSTESAAKSHDDGVQQVDVDDSSEQSQQETTEQVESKDSSDNVDVKLDPVIVVAETESEAATQVEDAVQVETVEVSTDLAETNDENPLESVELVDPSLVQVPETQTEVVEQKVETPEIAAVQVAVSDGSSKKRDSRRDSQAVQDVEGPEIVAARDDADAKGPAIAATEVETGPSQVGLHSDTSDDSQEGSRRRSRRSRQDKQPAVEATSFKEQSQKSAATMGVESAVGVNSEAAVEQPQRNAAETSPAARRAAISAITGAPVQAAANAPSNNSFLNSGNRSAGNQVTTGIDPSAPAKADSKPKETKAGQDSTANALTRAKLIQRVSKAFQHLGPDGGVVRLRLAPAELGTVRVEMRIDGRKVNARVVAETEAASSMLREHLPELRSRLESFGMTIEQVEIETEAGDSNLGGQFDNADRGNSWRDQQDRESLRQFSPRNRQAVSQAVSPRSTETTGHGVLSASGGVDLRL